MSLCYARNKIGFVHRDLHTHNILMQNTKRKSISYDEFGELEVLGLLPIIMDYDMSTIKKDNSIEKLEKIPEWSEKIMLMKNIKEQICEQKTKINQYIEMINSGSYKKSKKMKNMTLDSMLEQLYNTTDLETKVILYNNIQANIIEMTSELFDE